MYQSVFYNYRTKTYFIRDSNEGWLNFQHQPTYYKRIKEYKEGAYPVLTGGWAFPTRKLDKTDPNLLEKDINPELYILRELYHQEEDKIPEWHNITFLDIETEIGGALTTEFIKSAPMPITSIALLDKTTKTKICFIVDKTGEITEINGEDNKHVIPCKSEKELLLRFLSKWTELDPTIVVTWNGGFFDIPYLYYRIVQILGESMACSLSPLGVINEQEWCIENPVRIAGINHLDYMLIFKKYITKQEPSYKLGDIGEKYVDLGKIEYEGNLNQLFRDDVNTFIEYNLRDVEILDKLDDKKKFIDLTIMLSHICNIPYEQIYYNTVMNEGAILKYLKNEGIISPNKPTTHNENRKGKEEIYAGGYLLDPIPGLYFDVIDLDYTSLYPSIIKSLNLGIETLVGRIQVFNNPNYEQNHSLEKLKEKDPNEIITIQKLNKQNYTLKSTEIELGKLIEIIEKNKYTISASGAFFRTDEQSVCSKILEGWFEKREHYRELKKKSGKAQEWDKYKLFDLFQHAFKILQNAMYGTYAINSWRYTDGYMICSAAITNTGQRLDSESIDFVNNKLNTEYSTNENYIKLADTDSLYIELKDIIKIKYGNSLSKEEKNEKILELANEIQTQSNQNLDILCPKLFNIHGKHYFQLKQEVIAQSLLATGKRRYAMLIVNKEGIPIPPDHEDALDMKGLELMKSNMNKLFKKFGEQFIKDILFGKPKPQLDNEILEFYKSLKSMDPRKLGKPMGVRNIDNYIKTPSGPGRIFSEFHLKAPANTKASVRFNDLLKHKGLDKTYESIIEGDKIFIINLKPNQYRIDTIALPNSKVPEDIDKFVNEFWDVDEIFESLLLKKLKELYKDLGWEFVNLNENISKFFKF